MNLKRNISLLFSTCALLTIAQTMTPDAISFQDKLYLGNVMQGSQNPISINYSPINNLADFKVEYSNVSGDLKLIDQANTENWWNASIFGIKKFDKLSFEGGISYNNGSLNEKCWNNTLFVSKGNPYIIGDSIKSKFSPEIYNLFGTVAYQISNRWTIGLRAIYNVGSSANQSDPRPDIKGMRFTLNPGAEYALNNKLSIGLSARLGWLSETVKHAVVRTEVPQYLFLFQGLGNHEVKTAIGYKRRYSGSNYGVNANLTYKLGDYQNFFEGGYYHEYENSEDGTTGSKYNGGRYEANTINLSNRFQIKRENLIHNIILGASINSVEGTWFTQKQVTDDNGNLYWKVINESVAYTSSNYNGNLSYRIDFMNGDIPSLTAKVDAGFKNQEKRNKIYGAFEKYTEATADLFVAKNINIKRNQLRLSLNGGVLMNLSNSLNLDEFPSTLKLMMERYTIPGFEAVIANKYYVGGGVDFNTPIRIKNLTSLLGLGINYSYRGYAGNSEIMSGTSRNNINAHVSLTF